MALIPTTLGKKIIKTFKNAIYYEGHKNMDENKINVTFGQKCIN